VTRWGPSSSGLGVTSHLLRHTFGSTLDRAGGAPGRVAADAVGRFLGHHGPLHSVLAALLAGVLAELLGRQVGMPGLGLLVGYGWGAHVLADALTDRGVPLLWSRWRRRVRLPWGLGPATGGVGMAAGLLAGGGCTALGPPACAPARRGHPPVPSRRTARRLREPRPPVVPAGGRTGLARLRVPGPAGDGGDSGGMLPGPAAGSRCHRDAGGAARESAPPAMGAPPRGARLRLAPRRPPGSLWSPSWHRRVGGAPRGSGRSPPTRARRRSHPGRAAAPRHRSAPPGRRDARALG
jgi:LexA-binding, inner membrane-associated putative hydrolase